MPSLQRFMLRREQKCLHQNFSDKYTLQVIVPNDKEKDAIEIIRTNSKMAKIFISLITCAIDIESVVEMKRQYNKADIVITS
jgi:nitrogen regulatory protein PII